MKNVFAVNGCNVVKIAFCLLQMFVEFGNEQPIFLCVGNSNVVGDMFGPLCGDILKNNFKIKNVYGTLTKNVTSKNLINVYNNIKQKHPLSPIVVLDASVGECEEVGTICLEDNGCLPAHNTNNVVMGNVSVLGRVNVVGISDFMFLKTVKYKMVSDMAKIVCCSIDKALKFKKIYDKNSNNLCV